VRKATESLCHRKNDCRFCVALEPIPERIPGIAESNVEPIKSPATGEEERARIALPDGFEYKEAEMGNTVSCRVSAGDKLTFELKNTYAQLNAFDWSN